MPGPLRLLGIDPGLRTTGWGIVDHEGTSLRHVGDGSIRSTPDLPLAERLLELHRGLMEILDRFAPDEAAVEQTFVNKDATATLKLGQARGIALLAPAQTGLPVAEYAPNLVKKTVVGSGHADKAQILAMVKILLPRCTPHSADSADALAIAITHAHHRKSAALDAELRRATS